MTAASSVASGERARQLFVGRARELARLSPVLADVMAGRPRVVVVEGPSGTGKTTFVRHWLAAAGPLEILWATADASEAALPYGVLVRLFAGALDDAPGVRDIRADDDPLAVGAWALDTLTARTERHPVAVVVDDAQWSDTATLTALSFALRRMQWDSVLAVFCARDDDLVLPDGICRLAEGEGLRLRLGGLDAAELGEMAEGLGWGRLPRDAAERLEQHTGGSPLHARLLLEEIDPRALLHGDGPLPVPRSFALLVLHRLAGCSPGAEALVQAAAVLGRRCPLRLAIAVSGVDDPPAALQEAVDADLLEEAGSAVERVVAFTHPLVWAAVYHDLGPAQRAALHARSATLVAEPERLAHRVAAVLVEDADLALEVAARGAEEAAAGAHAAASSHFVAAARLAADAERRDGWRLDALEQLLAAGDVAGAVALCESVELPDSPRRSYLSGWLALLTGGYDEAERLLTAAWEAASGHDPALAGRACLLLANLASRQMRQTVAAEWSQRALESGAPEVLTAAVGILVPCLGAAGRAADAMEVVSATTGTVVPDDPVTRLARGMVRLWTDDVPGAVDDLSAVVAASSGHAASPPGLLALAFLAEAEYRQGDWDASLAHGQLAVGLARDSGQAWAEPLTHTSAAWAVAARGQFAQAQHHADEALAIARRMGDAASMTCAITAAAHVAFCRRDPAGLVETLEPALRQPGVGDVREPAVHPWPEAYADALITLGRLDDAERVLDGLEKAATELGRTSALAHAARARGRLQAARGDVAGADASFRAALDHLAGISAPFDQALVDDAYGRFLRVTGKRRAAAARLQPALETFVRLAAEPFVERCRRELAACGGRRAKVATPPGGTAPRSAWLTPQEAAVAQLVASGLTNRQVAAEMVVSVKTVEFHLGKVFAKLGLTSRSQLAARLAREGPLVGEPEEQD